MNDKQIKIQLEQLNFTVGDLNGNFNKIANSYEKTQDVDLVVFSELAITGYPPEDLLQKSYFIQEVEKIIEQICALTKDKNAAILVGSPTIFMDRFQNKSLYNSALLIENGLVKAIINKSNLPNYGVFDEKRYFASSPNLACFKFRDFKIAFLICEDIWDPKNAFLLSDKNLDIILTINASPFEIGKREERISICQNFIKHIKKPLIYVNQIGGQDSLLFDGSSFIINENGDLSLEMKEFEEDSAILKLIKNQNLKSQKLESSISKEEQIYNALILGLRDYIHKNNFKNVILGMSGGIDSALTATIATDALGNENVRLIALPTKYNSQQSLKDAQKCSDNLLSKLEIISIEPIFEQILSTLDDQFKETKSDTTEENIQSRIRGNILMALSNKFGNLLLSTGNKSELAVGYATIYGDMCGSFNPIKDVYKTQIFQLAKWRNDNIPKISFYDKKNIIPQNIITKEPSAELRENQKDSDSLPDYQILDKILYQLIEEEKSISQIIKDGFDEEMVKKVAKLFYNSEYKRKQAVIGTKISKKSFDRDRRYQITNKFIK